MTLPDERYRAVQRTMDFLIRVASGDYPRVPRTVREEARSLLRHYPTHWDLKRIEQAVPEVMAERMEPLHRMVVAYGTEVIEESEEHAELLRGYKE